jgi:hypothetical protein
MINMKERLLNLRKEVLEITAEYIEKYKLLDSSSHMRTRILTLLETTNILTQMAMIDEEDIKLGMSE